METITSRQNKEIKALVKLKMLKERKKQQKFIAEGLKVCKTVCKSGLSPQNVYATKEKQEDAKKLASEDKITLVSDEVMGKISSLTTPSGLLCVFPIKKAPAANTLSPGIVLAQISDPGNMGTLIRTSVAMGFQSVVTVEGVDPWNPKVVQASAGHIAWVSLFQWTWERLRKDKKDIQLVALVVKGGKTPEKTNLKNSLLVIGSEARGIPQEWITDCDAKLTLQMPGNTESLNAAVAGSIALYLASR